MTKETSSDQTVAGRFKSKTSTQNIVISQEEKRILQELARKVAERAARPQEKEKAEMWYKHNALEEVRPLVFCDPENGWNEIITQDDLQCSDALARSWEMTLRKEIFWGTEMNDDRVILPYFDIPYSFEDTGWGLNVEIIGGEGRSHGGSYRWKAPIEDWERDFAKLKQPDIIVDYEGTDKILSIARDIFGDILTVRLKGIWWWTLGMTWDFINLRGLQNFMIDMYDNPDWVHKLMGFLRDGLLHKLDFLQENNLLSLNTNGTYVGSGGFGWTRELPQPDFDEDHVRTMDMWGFTESQETVGVSAEMFGEFIFPYQKTVQERFGLNCYGCCEPIDPRWNVVKNVPRLRRVSVSPWADKAKMAEYLQNNYILSMKPSPTWLSQPIIDEEGIRKELRHHLEQTKGCRVEMIMKDNHTIGKNPDNVKRWTRIALEEAKRIFG
jgi:hypothetical protein